MQTSVPIFPLDKRRRLHYGPVLIVKGPHAGKLGIYDDEKNTDMAIVYLEPKCPVNYFDSEYAVVNKKCLVNVDSAVAAKDAH